ncbi:MAG: type II toxin-antitoxin system HicB family antitoxin [Nitrospira sp.]|nr:type II toxin-antitoxin system HicB family antitoxin [Nitrospira sp.]
MQLNTPKEFIAKAMEKANYSQLEDGNYYGEIEFCPGVWATGKTLDACRRVLKGVLEDWVSVRFRDGDPIPIIW